MTKVTKENIDEFEHLFHQGYNYTEIAKRTGFSRYTVSNKLKERKCHKNTISNLSQKELDEIIHLYKNNQTKTIIEKYGFSKEVIYGYMSRNKIKNEKFHWSDDDIVLLKENYGKMSLNDMADKIFCGHHSASAINLKASKLGLVTSMEWTEEELDILKNNYSTCSKDEILKLLPKRSINGIIQKAMQMGIRSKAYIDEKYSEQQLLFIKNNVYKMTDEEIAKSLEKPLSGVQEQRRKMGFYYLNKDYSNYESLSKFFRGHIQDWKNESMKFCNYKCIFTGSKDFRIHHLVGFNIIVSDTLFELDKEGKLKSKKMSDYSKEELSYFLSKFQDKHDTYSPLGICLRTDIHNLFHQIYGSGGNLDNQFNCFYENMKQHKYDDILNL